MSQRFQNNKVLRYDTLHKIYEKELAQGHFIDVNFMTENIK